MVNNIHTILSIVVIGFVGAGYAGDMAPHIKVEQLGHHVIVEPVALGEIKAEGFLADVKLEPEQNYDGSLGCMLWDTLALARRNIERVLEKAEKPWSLLALNFTWLDAELDRPSSFLSQLVYTRSLTLLDLVLTRYKGDIDLDGRQGVVARKTALMFALDTGRKDIIIRLLQEPLNLDAIYLHVDDDGVVHELTAFTYSDFFQLQFKLEIIEGVAVVQRRARV